MRTCLATLLSLTLMACSATDWHDTTDGGSSADGGKCPSQPDLVSSAAKCAAAKGLSGDILGNLCLDMSQNSTTALTSLGFNLTAATMNCAGWEVSGNTLQPKSINTAPGLVTCGLSLPSIPVNATKYPRVTLALIHQANLPSAGQQTRIELADISSPLRLWINPTSTVDQRTIIEIDTNKIPSGPNLQGSIQILAPMGSATPSWTISSIAVLGQPSQ